MVFWKSEVFSSLWLIKSVTSIQTVFTVIIGKTFSADFHLKTGVRELFLTLFNLSSEKSEVFSSVWLKRSATSIQTVFTVIIGKIFSADFHSKTGVREILWHILLCLLKRAKFFFIHMTNKECYLWTNSFHSHHWKKF